jgi:hypothetical protein
MDVGVDGAVEFDDSLSLIDDEIERLRDVV